MEKTRSSAELAPHELVHRFAVDRLSREPAHRRLHDATHVFRGRGAGFRNRVRDGLFERGGIERRWEIGFEYGDLGRFLLDEICAAALGELLNRVAALLDERVDDLPFFRFVEVTSFLDALVHERRFEHAEWRETRGVLLAHRVGDRSGDVVQE